MIKVIVAGATGRLGSLVCRLVAESGDMELRGAIASVSSASMGERIHGIEVTGPETLEMLLEDTDVYVDLTSAQAASENLGRVHGVNMVIGTTAIPDDVMVQLERSLADGGRSAVLTPNFSIGVNVFWKACEFLARVMPDYDIEVIETHHNRKRDAPSGTAKRAVEILSSAASRDEVVHGREGSIGPRGREIGVHAVRAGDVIGDHTVLFAGRKEVLELTHRAIDREAFAEGCIEAIRWVDSRRDGSVHGMEEVLGL